MTRYGPLGFTGSILALFTSVPVMVFAQASKIAADPPLGFVVDGGAARIHQPVVKTTAPALAGRLLYSGDTIETGESPAAFVLCHPNSAFRIQPHSTVLIQLPAAQVATGKMDAVETPPVCELPRTVRFPVAGTRSPRSQDLPASRGSAGSPDTREQRIRQLPPEDARQLREQLAPLETALLAKPNDLAARIARAAALDRFHLTADASFEYRRLQQDFPGAGWARGIEMNDAPARSETPATPGKTYALLIGISQYQRETGIASLRFADRDALVFEEFLKSPRGGKLPDKQILHLVNGEATREAVENSLNTFVRDSQGPNNTLIVMIAAHGATVPSKESAPSADSTRNASGGTVVPAEAPQPYILTTDTHPQDVATAGLAMSKLRETITQQAEHFRQVMVYLDVCRAGDLWPVELDSRLLSEQTAKDFETGAKNMGVMTATSPKEIAKSTSAYESPELDKHGAFTYYVLDGLNGAVPPTPEGIVVFDDLVDHVKSKVRYATDQKQRPEGHSLSPKMTVLNKEEAGAKGIALGKPGHLPIATNPRGKQPPETEPSATPAATDSADTFRDALHAGRLLPAMEIYRRMQAEPAADVAALRALGEELRIALEEKGQDVIVAYLRGAQPPLEQSDFEKGRDYFQAALDIFPDSPFDESRRLFCEGRALLFGRKYPAAVALLEQSIQMDPTRAYAYNALGIAWLEQLGTDSTNAERARAAFDDAIRFAPYWAYPLHNLALLEAARGDYDRAFQSLERAWRLAPLYSYLPYTIGLLNQQINRTGEARRYYNLALEAGEKMRDRGMDRRLSSGWPERAEILNALGTLADQDASRREATRLYNRAIAVDPLTTGARLNLAAMLSENGRRSDEAEQQWRTVIGRQPDLVQPHVKLAEYLERQGRLADAAAEYEIVVGLEPDYLEGHSALARLRLKLGRRD